MIASTFDFFVSTFDRLSCVFCFVTVSDSYVSNKSWNIMCHYLSNPYLITKMKPGRESSQSDPVIKGMSEKIKVSINDITHLYYEYYNLVRPPEKK